MTHRDGLQRFSASTPLHEFAYHTIAFPVSSAGGDARAMRAHRQAFPTPRGATSGGVPPTTYAGGAPATPEEAGKAIVWVQFS